MESSPTHLPRTLTVFTLAMINLAAIGSIKNWPVIAEYGFTAPFYLLLGALFFFLPVSLVTAELATGWPKSGGIFVWVKEAFGHRTGFLAIWLLWMENVIWYPTVLSFFAATLTYLFNPELATNTTYMAAVILIAFWGATFANMLGMRISSLISTFGVIVGTFIPGGLIILLGIIWYFLGKPLQMTFDWHHALPHFGSLDQFVFFTGVVFSFCGMEMSAIHARDVKHPQRDYPKAILLSGLILVILSLLGVLSIASVIPTKEINLVAGPMQAFSYFVEAYGLKMLIPYMAVFIAVGAFGSMSTWIAGPTKGLLAAAKAGDLPPRFRTINRHGMPTPLLLLQAGIVSLLSLVFLLMPNVNSAFWILFAVATQIYLIMYVLLFAAAIKLRYKKPEVPRPYRVPWGNFGIWLFSSMGILSALVATAVGFIPPSQIQTGKILFFELFLIGGVVLSCLSPSLILLFQKPYWKERLHHEKD